MAKFLKIDADEKTFVINVEHIRYMNALQHQPNHTNIHFAFDHVIVVPESIETLAARAEIP